MPISAVLRDRCRALLPPGAEIRYLFPATSAGTGRPVPGMMAQCVIFAVTDKNIILINTSWRNRRKPTKVGGTFARQMRFGVVDTSMIPYFRFAGQAFEIDDEYVSVVRAIDAELAGDMPADPLPDL